MNLEQLFCPNIDCPARGQANQGNLVIHSQIEKRCLCSVCNKSFAITKGTLFYRLRTDPKVVMCVIVLLAYGCPTQAIVQAFGFDERTVKNWWERAGHQCEAVHEHLIGQSQLDLQQVQADEIKAKILVLQRDFDFMVLCQTPLSMRAISCLMTSLIITNYFNGFGCIQLGLSQSNL